MHKGCSNNYLTWNQGINHSRTVLYWDLMDVIIFFVYIQMTPPLRISDFSICNYKHMLFMVS